MGKGRGVLAVDVGTTKICALVGEYREDGIWITGMGVVPSRGLKKGSIVNIEEAAQSINQAISKAKEQADTEIMEVYTSISGTYVKTMDVSETMVLKENQVTYADIDKILEAVRAVKIPEDREIIHIIPQEYIIDDQRGILHPVGMSGSKMGVHVKLLTTSKSSFQNLVKCFEIIGIELDGVIYQGLASAEAVLTEEEKELGVALVDFGGGTTDVVVFWDGVFRETFSIPVGGELLTNDLSVGLRTPRASAEKIKIEKGSCLRDLVEEDEYLQVPGIGNRPAKSVNKKIIAEIIELRTRELLELIESKIEKLNLKPKLTSGVVFTGGSSLLPGLTLLSDQILDLPTRIGYPGGLKGLNEEISLPQFATSVGMLLFVFKENAEFYKNKEEGFWEKVKKIIKFW